jgi:galactokinase
MFETHEAFADYEVSCAELDMIVTLRKDEAVVGSRLMGGGFGGCTINLIKKGMKTESKNNCRHFILRPLE